MSNETAFRVPTYRHHKPTNQAVVTLNGKTITSAGGTPRPVVASMIG
jgi:hypothetical protein